MKTTLYSLLAAAACGMALGQTAYTSPVGYTTTALAQGYNAIGLTLQRATLAAGNFETITATTLTDNGVVFAPVAGKTYVLEIATSPATPALVGSIFEIPAANISGSTITVTTLPATDLVALGLTSTATYKLRVAPTLEEIFTTTSLAAGGVLQPGLNSGTADVIWIPTGASSYDQYYLKSTGAFFKAGSTTIATPNIPVVYSDGLFVQKKGVTAASLTVSGEVKTVGTNSLAVQGYNLIGIVAPVGMNLFNSGLAATIGVGLNPTAADLVWVQQANLSYKKYFRHSSGNWRDVSASTVNMTQLQAEAVILSSGVLVQHKANSTIQLKLSVPSSYSSL
jgi:hypothetical protein